MSYGFLAGLLDSTQIGASLVATYQYAAGTSVNTFISVDGASELDYLECFYIPQVDFSPTSVMTLPIAVATLVAGGVQLIISSGSVPTTILVFGR